MIGWIFTWYFHLAISAYMVLRSLPYRTIGNHTGQYGTLGDHTDLNWRERSAFQRSAFGWSTTGNDVVATFFIFFFFLFFPPFFFRFFSVFPPVFFFFSVATFSHRRSAQIKKLIEQKLIEAPRGRHLSRPRWLFWGPPAAILDFAGGAAVWRCMR